MFRGHETDTSSSSSSNTEVRRPPITQAPSIQSDYCFEDARLRETTNAQKLLDLPINDKQSLIAKGILTKICRRRPKQRTFFLFNDALVYANISYGKLVGSSVFSFEDRSSSARSSACISARGSYVYRHGFIIETPKKSFTVYASIAEEKRRWVLVITQNAEAARQAAGLVESYSPNHCCCFFSTSLSDAQKKLSLLQKSPVWIPNSVATHCMVCLTTEFTMVQRRHHCRNCGKVVCGKCSQYRWVLPAQGPNKLRICRTCHELLRAQQESRKMTNLPTPVTVPDVQPRQVPVLAPPSEFSLILMVWLPTGEIAVGMLS
ncbi:unnamed protein product [Taenia asiatica]|uniref:FYVE-type domain-containing protein n=1 Tax=Taenia asiatica TaxID=60517 RepID=A0A158R889_TAEAS|nr:unnamed protein product [Taenia asiatica]